jgi:hypothetical protein
MTDEELAGVEARANAATTGPWEWKVRDDSGPLAMHSGDVIVFDDGTAWGEYGSPMHNAAADATFIAHARTDVPALVAEVRRLRGLVRDAYWEAAGGWGRLDSDEFMPDWDHSETRRALDGDKTPQDGVA